ncbi:MAG: class I adenylate-forming enzyme family protein [Bauldia sp.]
MNLATLVAHHARYQSTKIAVEARGCVISYGDFDIFARRVATRLRRCGVGVGDVVGIHLRDTPEHMAAMVALMRLGAVMLPLDWRSTAPELARIIARFGPRLVVTDKAKLVPADAAATGLDGIADEPPDTQPPVPLADQPLAYNLSSGTTGEPKALVLTHEEQFGRLVVVHMEGILRPEDRFAPVLPLALAAGRVFSTAALSLGATVVMFPTIFEPNELVRFVNERGLSTLMISANVCRRLISLPPVDGHLMPKLRALLSAGSKLEPEERAALRSRVSPNFVDYYGASGGGPMAIVAREEDGASPTAVGRPMVGVEIEIVDDNDRPVPAGAIGAVRTRGPGVVHAILGTGADSDEGVRDGWYYPGDYGSLDERGLVHLHGRSVELIKRGGAMVFAPEVEQALRRHANVADAAVIGVPSQGLGEEVVAFVEQRGPIDLGALVNHCRRELAPFKVPSRIEIVEALPRASSGKVVKARLRSML